MFLPNLESEVGILVSLVGGGWCLSANDPPLARALPRINEPCVPGNSTQFVAAERDAIRFPIVERISHRSVSS